MIRYVLKRLFIFVPTLLLISVITFALSQYAPGDPVDAMLGQTADQESASVSSLHNQDEAYSNLRHQLGLDLPAFYVTLTTFATPDTLYKVPHRLHQTMLTRLIDQYGNWAKIAEYDHALNELSAALYAAQGKADNANTLILLKQKTADLQAQYTDSDIKTTTDAMEALLNTSPDLRALEPPFEAVQAAYTAMQKETTVWKNYVPMLHWHGLHNQYHRWLSGMLHLDFGISYISRRPISTMIYERIGWTILLTALSLIIIYLLAIPLGIYSAQHRNSRADDWLTVVLFLLHSLPNYWIATLFVVYLCQPDFLNIFPPYGLGNTTPAIDGWAMTIADRAYHLILPLACISYGGIAFLSRQMRGGMLGVLQQDFIRTAHAKGLPEQTVVWRHALRNSLVPIITQFANIFPALIGGAITIELTFSIPGMSLLMYNAILAKDYPIVFTIVMLTAVLTMIGYLVADILYAFADPRIRFQ
jgi:peptide/nickel transport system permease protein